MTDSTKKTNIIGVTGHRKLEHDIDVIKTIIKEKLYQYDAGCVVTGMALGFDMLVAEVCIEEKIPFVAAIPCKGQTNAWPSTEKKRYVDLLKRAWKYKIVSPGPFATWKLFERNKWIVNRSTMLLSYWNGKPKGGTANTIMVANNLNRPHENLFLLCQTK